MKAAYRAVVGAVVLASVLACTGVEGERQNGECLDGERCAPSVPNGLEFQAGGLLTDTWHVAVDGTLTIHYAPRGQLGDPSYRPGSLGIPEITSDGDHLEVTQIAAGWFTVGGLEPGADRISVRSADNGALWDRIRLVSESVEAVEMVPMDSDVALTSVPRCGQPNGVWFRLLDGLGTPVYDSSAEVEAGAALALRTDLDQNNARDAFDLVVESDHPSVFRAVVRAGGKEFELELPVTDCSTP